MAKQGGLGDALYVGGYNLSGDIQSLGRVGGGPATTDTTGIDKLANERLGVVRDGGIEATSFFNPGLDAAHDVFSVLPTADVAVMYCRGTTLGAPAANLIGKQIDYAGNRAPDAAFTFNVNALANSFGLEWGRLATAGQRTDSGAANGTSIDDAAASAFGLQAYLHVFAFTGTSVTVKIQQSSDNGGADAFADVTGGSFAAVSAARQTQRIATAGNLAVERYLRVVTTGTFSNAVFAVAICRNLTATAF